MLIMFSRSEIVMFGFFFFKPNFQTMWPRRQVQELSAVLKLNSSSHLWIRSRRFDLSHRGPWTQHQTNLQFALSDRTPNRSESKLIHRAFFCAMLCHLKHPIPPPPPFFLKVALWVSSAVCQAKLTLWHQLSGLERVGTLPSASCPTLEDEGPEALWELLQVPHPLPL